MKLFVRVCEHKGTKRPLRLSPTLELAALPTPQTHSTKASKELCQAPGGNQITFSASTFYITEEVVTNITPCS